MEKKKPAQAIALEFDPEYDAPKVEHAEEKNRDQKNEIRRMYNQGKSIPQIAQELSCSEMEVQYTIDLG